MKVAKGFTLIKFGATAIALASLVLVVVGCSTDAPLAPTTGKLPGLQAISLVEDQLGDDLFATDDSGALGKPGLWSLSGASDHVDVGWDGGTVVLNFTGAVSELVIPEGAVCVGAEDDETSECAVQITAQAVLVKTVFGPVAFFDFGPDGLQFAKPAVLYLKTRLQSGEVLRLFWFNPETGKWERQYRAKVDDDGVVEFKIYHFSKYAIS